VPSTNTHTHTYTRAQAVVDQISVLFSQAGVASDAVAKVCRAVEERWVESVGLFLVRNGERVYEISAAINWSAHSDVANVAFATDLPGWDANGSPEALVLGKRFAGKAASHGLNPRFWVSFTPAIKADPAQHRRLCPIVGVVYQGSLPGWKATAETKAVPVQDLDELGLVVRSAL
jgi:hypothetical protein